MSRNDGQSLLKFKYNADGIRTNKIVDGVNHVYTLNGTQIVSEAWGNFLLIYLYDESGAPIGMQYRTNSYAANVFDTFYFEKNLQGDIIAVYNADGDKIGSYTYDAWGNCTVTVVSGTTTLEKNVVRSYNPFRYRGYYYDTETGLYYLQSRYYNPAWGRFLNADGYVNANGDLIGFNMYAYCSNKPVIYADSQGTDAYLVVTHMMGEDASPNVGHSFLLIENEDGKWYMTQFQKRSDEGGTKVYTDYLGYINPYDYIGEYDLYVHIKGDFSNSVGVAIDADKFSPRYIPWSNNCLQYNVDILRQGFIFDVGYRYFIANNRGLVPTTYINELKAAKSPSSISSLRSPSAITQHTKKMFVENCLY